MFDYYILKTYFKNINIFILKIKFPLLLKDYNFFILIILFVLIHFKSGFI